MSIRFNYDHVYEAGVWTSDTYDFNYVSVYDSIYDSFYDFIYA